MEQNEREGKIGKHPRQPRDHQEDGAILKGLLGEREDDHLLIGIEHGTGDEDTHQGQHGLEDWKRRMKEDAGRLTLPFDGLVHGPVPIRDDVDGHPDGVETRPEEGEEGTLAEDLLPRGDLPHKSSKIRELKGEERGGRVAE